MVPGSSSVPARTPVRIWPRIGLLQMTSPIACSRSVESEECHWLTETAQHGVALWLEGERFWGQDRLDFLDRALDAMK